ncbi:sensor histidine kinase [Haloferula sp.]|uniref:sensor histidine kinase n=1 Tax=Haloferula sp. TaxID=2497595 RepID=UPI003C77EAFC
MANTERSLPAITTLLTIGISYLVTIRASADELGAKSLVNRFQEASLSELEARKKYVEAKLDDLPRSSMRSGSGSIGYRSNGFSSEDQELWVEIHLDQPSVIDQIVLVSTIWRSMTDGFQADGFPSRFRIRAGTDDDPEGQIVASFTEDDELLPRVAPVIVPVNSLMASWVRIETQRLSRRAIDNRAALQMSEILLFSGPINVALHQRVSATSSQNIVPFAWHEDHLVDGYMPYLVNSAKGGQSVAYISSIVDRPKIMLDLEQDYPLSELHLHTVEQGDTVPQAYTGTFGIPQHLRVTGSKSEDFADSVLLYELFPESRTEYGPVIMSRFNEVSVRYVKFEGDNEIDTSVGQLENERLGFAEIALYSKGTNVALGKTATANHSPNSPGRLITALTDGMNLYGEIPPLRDWLENLAYRHKLETELPLIVAELGNRYDRQKSRLSLMTWIAAIFATSIGFIMLIERNRRMKQADKIRRRIAANLHDELGADLHAIGLLGDHAINVVDSREELIDTARRIRSLTEETGATARHCTNMLESGIEGANFITEMRRAASRLMDDTNYHFSVEGAQYLTRLKPRRRIDLMLFHKECLMNTIRHSDATQVRSKLSASQKMILLEVVDNGIGLEGRVPPSLKRRAKLMRAEVTCAQPETGGSRIVLSLRLRKFQGLL